MLVAPDIGRFVGTWVKVAVAALAAVGALSALFALAGCGGVRASSSSGVELAYSVEPETGQLAAGIYLVDHEGEHRTRLTRSTAPDAVDVSWSATGDLLLAQTAPGEVWTIRSDGTALRKIGEGVASWSPDGSMIALGRRNAVEILSAGGQLRKTLRPRGADGYVEDAPSWSPDGTQVAFAVSTLSDYAYGTSAIFVAPVSGDGGALPLMDSNSDGYDRDPYWSPDGKLLAFESGESGEGGPIWTSRPDGSQRRRIAELADLRGWAPDGKALVCTEAFVTGYDLYAYPLNGGGRRRLTKDEEEQFKRVLHRDEYAPDGRQHATVSDGGAVIVRGIDGSKRVVTDPASDEFPEWSPDGERLAFARTDSHLHSWVHVIEQNGAGERRLVPGTPAAWLSGSAGLLVTQEAQGGHRRYMSFVTLEGATRRLAAFSTPGYGQPAVTPDGDAVAYTRGEGTPTIAINVKGTRGGPERKLAQIANGDYGSAAEVGDLAWSADGQALFGVWALPGADYSGEAYGTLHLLTRSGSSSIVARRVVPGLGIAVSPDGERVAFVGNRGLEVVELDSGDRRLLVSGDPDGDTIEGALDSPRWSPDGSTLAYLTGRYADAASVLETVSVDGSERKRVSAPGEEVGSFSWRPRADDSRTGSSSR